MQQGFCLYSFPRCLLESGCALLCSSGAFPHGAGEPAAPEEGCAARESSTDPRNGAAFCHGSHEG